MSDRVCYRYSEAFKLQVIGDIESGRFAGARAASRAYGIRGCATVSRWIRQYGKGHLLPKVVRVMKPDEPAELARLKARIRDLERALSDSYMDGALDRAFFRMLCEQTSTDPEAFKKKHESMRSGKSGKGRVRKDGR